MGGVKAVAGVRGCGSTFMRIFKISDTILGSDFSGSDIRS